MGKKKGDKKRSQSASPQAEKPTSAGNDPKPKARDVSDTSKPAPSEPPPSDAPSKSGPPPSEPPPSDAPSKSGPPPSDAPSKSGPLKGASWGKPFLVVDRKWTWFEERLLVFVIALLVLQLCFWVVLKGMQEPVNSESSAGMVLRGLLGLSFFGGLFWWISGKLSWPHGRRSMAAAAGLLLGIGLAPTWRDTGVQYSNHLFNWLQEGSNLSMFGGLRGVSTRLTILLAMIGASLAAAGGKHINIDVLLRFVSPKLRLPSYIGSMVATIAVCVATGIGFFDYIAVDAFGAQRDWDRSAKFEKVSSKLSQDLFLYRRQVGFDLSALPHVLGGGKWDDESRMDGRRWNEFIESSGYREVYKKEQVDALLAPQADLDSPRLAMAVGPDGMPRGLMVKSINMTFVIGFFVLALRFFLKLMIVLSGNEKIELEGEGDDDESSPDAAAEGSKA